MIHIDLNSNFVLRGKKMEDFFDTIQSMDDITKIINISSQDLAFGAIANSYVDAVDIALVDTPTNNQTLDSRVAMYKNYFKNIAEQDRIPLLYLFPYQKFTIKTIKKSGLIRSGADPYLIHDLEEGSKMLIGVNNQHYIVLPTAVSSFLSRAEFKGNAFSKPSVGRVIEIAKMFQYKNPQNVTLVTRQTEASRIVVSIRSNQYEYIPQMVLKDAFNQICSEFGAAKCDHWEVTHKLSECYVDFPDISNALSELYDLPDPLSTGIHFGTSDSGDSSIFMCGYWKCGTYHFIDECCHRSQHKTSFQQEKFTEEAMRKVYSKFSVLPERLCQLLTMDIDDPEQELKSIWNQIDVPSILGKRYAKKLYPLLCNELVPSMRYTAYDIAMKIASIPSRSLDISPNMKNKMEVMATKAVFAKYSTEMENVEEEEKSLVLV